MHLLDGEDDADVRVTRSLLATRYASARRTQGRFEEALRWATLAAREAEDAGNKQALAHAYNGLQAGARHRRAHPELPYGRLALMAYEELGDLSGQGHCLNNLAIEANHDGRWTEAQGLLVRASQIFTGSVTRRTRRTPCTTRPSRCSVRGGSTTPPRCSRRFSGWPGWWTMGSS